MGLAFQCQIQMGHIDFCTYQDCLVVVSVGDGVGVRARAAHLEEDLDGEHGLRVRAAQLHHHAVADLVHRVQLQPLRKSDFNFELDIS